MEGSVEKELKAQGGREQTLQRLKSRDFRIRPWSDYTELRISCCRMGSPGTRQPGTDAGSKSRKHLATEALNRARIKGRIPKRAALESEDSKAAEFEETNDALDLKGLTNRYCTNEGRVRGQVVTQNELKVERNRETAVIEEDVTEDESPITYWEFVEAWRSICCGAGEVSLTGHCGLNLAPLA
eukprot:jgi/Botrbrau1/16350/Bobra.178_1s0003.1